MLTGIVKSAFHASHVDGFEPLAVVQRVLPYAKHRTVGPFVVLLLPDDPEASAYRFIIVAAKRARQLQNGARSLLPSTSKKPTVAAMEEVRRGLVPWEDLSAPPVEPVIE